MALKTVKWTTTQPLPCGECVPANVILCIKTELIDQTEFEDSDVVKKTIIARITESSKTCGPCVTYKYTFEYEDSQLEDPLVPLSCSDVLGAFCLGCFASWIEEQIELSTQAAAPEVSEYAVVTAHGTSDEQVAFPIVATAVITNPSATLPMRVTGTIQFAGRFVTIASASTRTVTRDFTVDAVSPLGDEYITPLPSATGSAMNSPVNWTEDLGKFTDFSDDLTLLDPGEAKTYEVTFDATLVGGDTIDAVNCFLNLTGINYNP